MKAKKTFPEKVFRFNYIFLFSVFIIISSSAFSSAQERNEINIPDIPGYYTLKCDFHIHTVFSDGIIWPTIRVKEAWFDGLDAISISDHIEYQPHSSDVPKNLNRSYRIALPSAREYGIIFPKGAEITKQMPPGHFNAIFINDAELLDVEDGVEAVKRASEQGAFIFWNHPGDKWYPVHTEILENGWIHGAEVVNGNTYYPEVHKWALEKNLTILCNSDIHDRIDYAYDPQKGEHRPVTLVFVKDKTLSGLKEALFDRRTAAYYKNILIGHENYLRPVFNESVKLKNPDVIFNKDNSVSIQLHNSSDLDFKLKSTADEKEYSLANNFIFPAHKTVMLKFKKLSGIKIGENNIELPYEVTNMLTAPGTGLDVKLSFSALNLHAVRIVPSRKRKGTDPEFKFLLGENKTGIDIYYTLDGSDPTLSSNSAAEPFKGKNTVILKYAAFKAGKQIGDIVEKNIYFHKALGKDINLENLFSPRYTGGGEFALVNGIKGSENYLDGEWQGYEGENMIAVIDLNKETALKEVRINFLQDTGVWIFPPTEVEILISPDGGKYNRISGKELKPPKPGSKKEIKTVTFKLNNKKARFIKIHAKNIRVCPDWHKGAGGKAWIFTDEIIVK
ncbi:Sb-PDE family phosphodiesterase [candidate division KSB1 bacterium]